MKTHFAIVSLFVATILEPGFTVCQESGTLDMVKKKSDQWEKQSASIQGELVQRTSFKAKGKEEKIVVTRKIKQNAQCVLLIESTLKEDDSKDKLLRTAFATNPKYAFVLGEKQAGWILRELSLEIPPKLADWPYPVSMNRVVHSATSVIYPWAGLDEKEFKIIKNEVKSENGRSVLLIHFENKLFEPKLNKLLNSSSGTMRFSTDADLSLLTIDSQSFSGSDMKRKVVSRTVNEYSGRLGDFPRPVKRTNTAVVTDGNGETSTTETTIDFDLRYDPGVPDTEFTLSAFGLPEPKGVAWSRPTPWWVWWGMGGVPLVVLGVWLRRRGFSASKSSPAKG